VPDSKAELRGEDIPILEDQEIKASDDSDMDQNEGKAAG
jgi:hypothetical protein